MKRILSFSLLLFLCVVLSAQSKMSPNTRQLVSSLKQPGFSYESLKSSPGSYLIREINDEKYVNAYIYLNENYDTAVLEEHRAKINSRLPGIVTASVPVSHIEEIAGLKEVKYLQIGSPVYKLMDKARETTLVDKVQAGSELSAPFQGTGVVVGIIDTGFEYGHPNFYNADQTELRIKRVWDQNKKGTPPNGFNYGTELKTKAEILNAKNDNRETHGSHVTGIAAGADKLNDNTFYGIASNADIVLVSMNTSANETENVTVSDGIKFIYDYAESVGKPCVINMSLGSHIGPHDGTSSFDVISDAMQGKGKLLVGAAGNEGRDNLHISKNFEKTSSDSLNTFLRFDRGIPYGMIDIWGEKDMKYTIQLQVYDKTKRSVKKYFDILDASKKEGNEESYSLVLKTDGANGYISVITEVSPLNGKPHTYIAVELSSIQNSVNLGFSIKPLSTGTVHIWADDYFTTLTNNNVAGYTQGNSQYSVGEIGGTGKRIISTGAYVSKNNYKDYDGDQQSTGQPLNKIATFSSLGPTPDGRIKPDITAPGTSVGSSISSYDSDLQYEVIVNKTTWNGNTYYYGMMDGTSMASPCVTGILATWLQANPELTPEDVKSILSRTAIRDSYTGVLPEEGNSTWGYGKIDAWNGIKEILKMGSGISQASALEPIILLASDKHGFRLLFTGECPNATVAVYDMNGKQVYNNIVKGVKSGEERTFSMENINQGMYIVKVTGNQMLFTSKLVIR